MERIIIWSVFKVYFLFSESSSHLFSGVIKLLMSQRKTLLSVFMHATAQLIVYTHKHTQPVEVKCHPPFTSCWVGVRC